MARKIATVSDHPTRHRRRGRPITRLTSAIDSSEREMLVALRRQIATQIDAGVPAHVLAELARLVRAVDADIRSIDAAAAQVVEDEDEGEGDLGGRAFDPSSV
jgi:hypothetical protein